MGDKGPKLAPYGVALLIIDMINPLDFEGAQRLKPSARAAAVAIVRLRADADRLGVPVIYVNDNYGRWLDDRAALMDMHLRPGTEAEALARDIRPRERDYFVIKPQFSGFYATNLPVLLPRLRVSRLVLAGIAANICILFTAADAHMREYDLWVPADAVASEDEGRKGWALEVMANSMGAQTAPVIELSLDRWATCEGRRVRSGRTARR